MATRTTSQSGAWNSTATWGGSPVPGSGDRAVIGTGHNVTVTANQTVGEGLDPTVRAIDLLGGSLTIAEDVIFTQKGKLHCTDTAAITMQQGSKWLWDVPAGLAYEFKHYNAPFTINGTQAKPCEFSSIDGGGIVHIPMWGIYPAPINFNHCAFIRVGNASTPAINAPVSVADSLSVRNCTFDLCGQLLIDNQIGSGFTVVLEDTTVTNSQHATRALTFAGAMSAGSSFKRCWFDKESVLVGIAGWTLENVIFNGGIQCSGTAWDGALLKRCLVRDAANVDVNLLFSVEDTYWLEDFAGSNPHGFTVIGDRNVTIDGIVFEYSGTHQDGDMILPGLGGSGTPRTLTITRALQVLGAGGSQGGSLVTMGGGPDDRVIFNNNTGFWGEQALIRVGESYAGHAGLIQEFRNNIITGDAGGTEKLFIHDISGSVANLLTAANATNNAAGPGASAGTNGKGYDNLSITVGTPGTNDLPLGTDPEFVDSARNLGEWDDSLGGAGTTAAALARIQADPTLAYEAYTWIREGFVPTNPDFETAAHDGGTIGAMPFGEAEIGDNPPGRLAYIQNMVDFVDGPLAWYAANPLSSPTASPASNHHYNHDTPHAFRIALQYHPGNADITSCLASARQGYMNYVNNSGGAVADPYGHARGLFMLWEEDGDTEARDAALLVRDFGAGIAAGSGVWEIGSRPIAYRLTDFIDAHRLGFRTLTEPQWSEGITWAKGHIGFWLGDPAVWAQQQYETFGGAYELDQLYTQHFMMGMTGHSLSLAHEYIHETLLDTDDTIIPSLLHLAAMLRWRHWRPTNVSSETYPGDFKWAFYLDGHYSPVDGEFGDWANFITANFFAYLWKVTGCTLFRDWGDEALLGGVDCQFINSPKEYAEYVRQFHDWDRWRQATPGTDDDYLVAIPPFHPYATVGEASEVIKVTPLKSITGTLTLTDGEWSDTLTWAGDASIKEIAYTPLSSGDKTITFSNNMGLVNPLSQGWVVSGEEPEPDPVTEYTFTGPTSGELYQPSGLFTVTLGAGEVASPIRFTPQAEVPGSGSFSPTFVDLTNILRSATFIYTPTNMGARDIGVVNNGGLPYEPAIEYTPTEPPEPPGEEVQFIPGETVSMKSGRSGERILIIPMD